MGLDWKRLLALGAALAVGLFFWDAAALYPLKLLVVLIHESGHAIAAWAMGAREVRMVIDARQGGACTFAIDPTFWNEVVISSAGYLASGLAGAVLLFATLRRGSGRLILWLLCAFLLAVAVLWARTLFTLGVALGMSAALGLLARILPAGASGALAFFLSSFIGLYALFDLRDDLWSAARRAGTDAAILARATHVPSIVWAVLWSLLAIAMLAAAVYFGARVREVPAPAGARPRRA
jgi:hypothetical protein